MKQFLQRKKRLLITMAACYLAIVGYRLAFLQSHFYFSQDEARDILLMQQHIDRGEWIVGYGPKASVGDFYLPPFYYQVHILVTRLVGNQPWAMHLLTLLVESASPLVLFAIASLFFSRRSALVAAVLYAISFQPLTYGVNAWNPNMIPFFTLLALYGWLQVLIKKRYAWIPPSVLCLTIAVHLHYQAILVVPFALIVFGVTTYRSRFKSWRWWTLGALLALLLTSPYLYAEMRSNWHNTRQIIHYFTQDHAHYYDRIGKFAFVTSFIPSYVERSIAHETVAEGVVGLGVLVVGGGALLQCARTKPAKQLHWVLLYYALILVMLRVYKGDKLDYYMSTLLALPALCVAGLLELSSLLGSGLSLVLAIMAIRAVWALPPVNQLRELEAVLSKISSTVSGPSVQLVVHDDDFVNTLVYGITTYTSLRIDQRSLHVLEVYAQGRQPQTPLMISDCSPSEANSYFDQLHQSSGYETLARLSTPDYHIDVAVLKCSPNISVPHPLSGATSFGSDSVVPDILSN